MSKKKPPSSVMAGAVRSKLDSLAATPDPLDFLKDGAAISQKGDDKMDDLEQMDRLIEQISLDLQSFGFPDCGNLRSTKKKDVKMRIKSFQTLLRQRRKDLEFRNGFQDKFKKYEADAEAMQDKNQRNLARIKQVESKNAAF